MRDSNHWEKYSNLILDYVGVFQPNDDKITLYSLADEIGRLYSHIKEGIIDKIEIREIISTVGHIYYNIVALELQYELPYSLYSNKIGMEITESVEDIVNLDDCLFEYMEAMSLLVGGVNRGDISEIQFNLNTILRVTFDICMKFNINTSTPLKFSVVELSNMYNPVKDEKGEEDDYKTDFKKRRSILKSINLEEALFEVIQDRRKENPYKGISLKVFGETHKFTNGDIIVDFFRAMTKVDAIKGEREYGINYGPKYRKYMNDNVSSFWSGFLVEDEVLSVMTIQEKQETINGTVSMGKEARPIIMNSEIKDMDTLIDYIHKKESV